MSSTSYSAQFLLIINCNNYNYLKTIPTEYVN